MDTAHIHRFNEEQAYWLRAQSSLDVSALISPYMLQVFSDFGSSRLSQKSQRKDFLSKIIDKVEAGEISQEELTAHTSTLV